jgi:hypothetical protein
MGPHGILLVGEKERYLAVHSMLKDGFVSRRKIMQSCNRTYGAEDSPKPHAKF